MNLASIVCCNVSVESVADFISASLLNFTYSHAGCHLVKYTALSCLPTYPHGITFLVAVRQFLAVNPPSVYPVQLLIDCEGINALQQEVGALRSASRP